MRSTSTNNELEVNYSSADIENIYKANRLLSSQQFWAKPIRKAFRASSSFF